MFLAEIKEELHIACIHVQLFRLRIWKGEGGGRLQFFQESLFARRFFGFA